MEEELKRLRISRKMFLLDVAREVKRKYFSSFEFCWLQSEETGYRSCAERRVFSNGTHK